MKYDGVDLTIFYVVGTIIGMIMLAVSQMLDAQGALEHIGEAVIFFVIAIIGIFIASFGVALRK